MSKHLVMSQDTALVVMLIPSKEELFSTAVVSEESSASVQVCQRLRAAQISFLDLYPALREGGLRERHTSVEISI